MKKSIKICAIALLALAMGLNIQYAVIEYYGIKTNTLAAQIWGQEVKTPYSEVDATNGSNGDPINTGTSEEGSRPKFTTVTESRACQDLTANITFSQGSTGSTGASVQLGPLGTYNIGVNGGGTSVGGGTITNYKITYPKNSDGSAQLQTYTFCYSGGSSSCHSSDPCLSAAIRQIQSAF